VEERFDKNEDFKFGKYKNLKTKKASQFLERLNFIGGPTCIDIFIALKSIIDSYSVLVSKILIKKSII